MSAGVEHRFYCMIDITHVVHRIKDTENVNTVDSTTFDKLINDIIGIMPIA